MSKDLNIAMLFDFYRNILTEKQAEIIDLYYNEDLSLSEISEHLTMTRQGVRDNIKRAEAVMIEMEEDLGLAKRYAEIKSKVNELSSEIDKLGVNPDQLNKIKMLLSKIEE